MISYTHSPPLGQRTAAHRLTEVDSDSRGGRLERVCNSDLSGTVHVNFKKKNEI